ncbi:hypothetical protein WDU94_015426 [Cyamophila willieti]
MRSFLFFTLLTLVVAADKGKHKSSSIYETESHHGKGSSEESGLSESGLSESPASPESSESEIKVKVTKKKAGAVKKKKEEVVEEKKATVLKKVIRSSKFPNQFATKKLTKPSSEYDDEEDEATVGKKLYQDVGYRKEKFKERVLKEKRKDTTTNPNKRKKAPTTQKPTKKRHYTGYNTSDLISSPPVTPGEDMLHMFTINETVTAILNKKEIQVDQAKAGEILADLRKKYEKNKKELPTEERSEDGSINDRSDNSMFNNSTILTSDYDDDEDEDEDEEEEYESEEDESKHKGKDEHGHKSKHRKHKDDISEDADEELTSKEKHRRRAAQYSTKEKEERTIQLFNILRNNSNISIPSEERLHHRKIILDTLREQGEDVHNEDDIVSHYDSDQSSKSGAKRSQPKLSTTTEKKGPLWSIEQAYKRAVKSAKNGTNKEESDSDGKSKGYEKVPLDKVMDKARESLENKKWMKKSNGTTVTKRKIAEKRGEKWTARPQGSRERKSRQEVKEAYDPRDKRRYESRERGRGRYGETRDRDRGNSRERYRGRYDSRQRFGDRRRFDSRERGRYGDRGPPRYDRGPPRYDRGPPRDDRGPPRDDRGPPPYGRDRYDRDRNGGRDGYRGREDRGRYGDRPRYNDRDDRRGYYERREEGGRREGGRFEGRREGGGFAARREEGKREEGEQDVEGGGKREERPTRPPWREDRKRHKPSRERQTKKKWFSEEITDSKAALAGGPKKSRPTDRAAGNFRSGGRNRGHPRAKEDSFERDYNSFAGNDEKNSEYQKVIKAGKFIPISNEIVTIP